MDYRLQNAWLTASIKAQGAELCSLTDCDNTEYIWNADPAYWGRHTPILFPLVGKVINNEYTHEGVSYSLGQHGFARDVVFAVTNQSDTSITFTLTSSQSTKMLYPFDFVLSVIYTLEDTCLSIKYVVENTDTTTIGFKIGAHPGFMCPLLPGETMEDYFFEFEKEERATLMPLTSEGYFTGDSSEFKGQRIDLSPEVFAGDALVLTNLESTSIAIRSHNHGKSMTVGFKNFPFLGLWSPHKRSPFVCIEPWFGHADCLCEATDLMSKKDIVTLAPSKTFECVHTMTVTNQNA